MASAQPLLIVTHWRGTYRTGVTRWWGDALGIIMRRTTLD
jgi:hypothetical protein